MQKSASRRFIGASRNSSNSGLPTHRDVLTISLCLNILLAMTLMFLWDNTLLGRNENIFNTGSVQLHGDVQEWNGGHPVTSRHKGTCWCNEDPYCMCTPSVAIDLVVLSGKDHIWLARRRDTGQYAVFGGFVKVGESTENAVFREFYEETGIQLKDRGGGADRVKLLGVYSDPRRDNRRHTVSIIYVIQLDEHELPVANDDVKAVARVRLSDIDKKFNMFADHKTAVLDYIGSIREKKLLETIQRSSPGDFANDIQRSICPG